MDQSENQNQSAGSDQQQGQEGTSPIDNIGEVFEGVRNAVSRFQQDQTPENFASIVTALGGFGLGGLDLWKQAADYTRKHPLQVAVGAGVLFFALRGLSGARPMRQLSASVH